MQNHAPPARYDESWKLALTHSFRDFISFFFPQLSSRIDWSKRPYFLDKELAGLGLSADPDYMVADKLVEVWLRDGGKVLIHIEVQAQHDASLAQRIFDYHYRIFKEYGLPVASLVLLADEVPGWRPGGFGSDLLGTVLSFSFSTAKLLDYAARSDELESLTNPFALVAQAHLRTQQARHDSEELYAAKWQLTRQLYQHGRREERIIVLFKVINWMMALPEPLQRRYWQAALQLEKERNMELMNPLEQMFFDDGVEAGLKRGLKQGLEQGLEQGRKEAARAMLARMLARRFGPLSKTTQSKLAKASVTKLEAWSEALLEAQSLKQVFAAAAIE